MRYPRRSHSPQCTRSCTHHMCSYPRTKGAHTASPRTSQTRGDGAHVLVLTGALSGTLQHRLEQRQLTVKRGGAGGLDQLRSSRGSSRRWGCSQGPGPTGSWASLVPTTGRPPILVCVSTNEDRTPQACAAQT